MENGDLPEARVHGGFLGICDLLHDPENVARVESSLHERFVSVIPSTSKMCWLSASCTKQASILSSRALTSVTNLRDMQKGKHGKARLFRLRSVGCGFAGTSSAASQDVIVEARSWRSSVKLLRFACAFMSKPRSSPAPPNAQRAKRNGRQARTKTSSHEDRGGACG